MDRTGVLHCDAKQSITEVDIGRTHVALNPAAYPAGEGGGGGGI